MNLKPTRPRIYVSHSVRGDGTKTMAENCIYASRVANKIRRLYPEVDIWVPGEKDLTIQLLEADGRLSVEDIIWADLEILRNSNGWMWIWTSASEGCEEEEKEAEDCGFTNRLYDENIIFTDLLKANYNEVRRLVGPIVEKAKARFKENK